MTYNDSVDHEIPKHKGDSDNVQGSEVMRETIIFYLALLKPSICLPYCTVVKFEQNASTEHASAKIMQIDETQSGRGSCCV